MTSRLGIARTVVPVLIALVGICCKSAAQTQTLDQLYSLAKEEKTVVVWAPRLASAQENVARAFEQRFPGIQVLLNGDESNDFKGVDEQLRASKSDVVILQTIHEFIRWDARGLLLRFKPEGFDKVGLQAKDSNGAWIAVNLNPIFYGYNPQHLRGMAVPKLAIDFLRQGFKGRLITGFPSENDTTLFAFATIVQKYGWGYMAQYMRQQPRFVQDQFEVARSIGSGESLTSFDVPVSNTFEVQRDSGIIALIGPTDDYLPVAFTGEAILKDATHPNAAKLYVSWLLSKEVQARAGVYPSRSDVPAPNGLPQLSTYRLEDRYLDFLSSEERRADLRRRFEAYTGPVKKRSDAP
jgi:ABC-type Fe3+ transport system substrate-binding protein